LFRAGQVGVNGWKSLARDLTVKELNGDHHSIMRPPEVNFLAATLLEALEETPLLA
jgi:thioesterase domain-containing protein